MPRRMPYRGGEGNGDMYIYVDNGKLRKASPAPEPRATRLPLPRLTLVESVGLAKFHEELGLLPTKG